MKSGKDDEKIMGPMFPRLHVNDTDKGGPRAPPRNKMALYEQLSIPSQRFNHGALPLNHPNNTSGLILPESSTQGSGLERSSHFPLHVPPSTTTHQAERFLARRSEGATLNTPLAQLEQRKNVGDEDDFVVPVFVQSGTGQCHGKTQNTMDREKLTAFSPTYSGHSIRHRNVCDMDPKPVNSPGLNLRREVRSDSEVDPKVSVPSHSARSPTDISTREKIDGPMKEANATLDQEYRDYPVANFSSLDDIDSCLQQGVGTRSQRVDTEHVESMRDVEKGNVPHLRSVSHSREDHSSPNEPYNDREYYGDRTCVSLQVENIDKSDDVSEISMVDSISCLDISPDDVVGIIGQKHFWKARRAIANQQRVFAVQVFELHRLIKVQRLIAASPHLLLEDGAFLGNSSWKGSPANKLPSDFVVQPPPHIVKQKYDSEKPNLKMECSAENVVGKTTLSSVKNGSQPSDFGPSVGNLQPVPMATDTKMGPWSFPQSPGHQWLIPVMSPYEGLVYKPYPGPGFMGTVCGGCGPFSPAPLTRDLMNPAYGVPASHHQQGFGVLPGTSPVGHTYFPPYGMPRSAVKQVNQFSGPGSDGETGPLSGGGANFNMQHQSSCNVPKQRKGTISQGVKSHASKDSELQASTASSPSKRAQGVETGHTSEGRDALPLFPMAPVVPETAPQPHDTNRSTRVIKVVPHNPRSATESTTPHPHDTNRSTGVIKVVPHNPRSANESTAPHPHDTNQSTRVIKVVPHNPRSATESAARIFQSIQEERKQYESV